MDLSVLGISREELIDRIVNNATDQLLHGKDSEAEYIGDTIHKALTKRTNELIATAVNDIGDKYVMPNLIAKIDTITMEETNSWGEKKGAPMTFREYLIKRAEVYMTEQVDYEGKPKGNNGYSWKGEQTRVARMVHEHLHYHIENAMKEALKQANSVIVAGLQKTVEMKLKEISEGLSVQLQTRK